MFIRTYVSLLRVNNGLITVEHLKYEPLLRTLGMSGTIMSVNIARGIIVFAEQ